MTQIEQIKAEIERLKSQLVRGACAAGIAMETNCKEEAYNEVLAFIDSLPADSKIEQIKAELQKRLLKYDPDYTDAGCELKELRFFIASLQQEEDKDSKEAAIQYRDSIFRRIEEKRVLPSFKGQLLHDFKNELNTMEQILGIKNWSDIQYALFEKFALVFATWGGYHFHPKETESEDSLQQEQPEMDLEKEIAHFALNGGTGDNTPTIGETAHHFYELGLNARKED